MIDIKALNKIHSEQCMHKDYSYSSFVQTLRRELNETRDNINDIEIETQGKIEWLKARSRISEVALTSAFVGLVISAISLLLQIRGNELDSVQILICVLSLIIVVPTAAYTAHQMHLHKKECDLLSYYTIKMELIKEITENEKLPVNPQVVNQQQRNSKPKKHKSKRYGK